jgi:hypothetical protein
LLQLLHDLFLRRQPILELVPCFKATLLRPEIRSVCDHRAKRGGTLVHLSRYHVDDIRIMLRIVYLSISGAFPRALASGRCRLIV